MSLDSVDRKLLNLVQSRFPLEQEPYDVLGQTLGVSWSDVVARVDRLREKTIIRSISAVFEAKKLGYHSTLVAMRLDDARVEDAAALINSHPGVSHNYLRDHCLNLWFTLTAPKDSDLGAIAGGLGERAGAQLTLSLPAVQVFKIDVFFDMDGQDNGGNGSGAASIDGGGTDGLSDADRALVRELQRDLPPVQKPFDEMADRLELETSVFLEGADSLKKRGIMRRYGARINHRRAGFVANAMCCWVVEPGDTSRVGKIMAAHQQVSHCYERQTAPQWPYSVYTMIHGRTEEEARTAARSIAEETGLEDYAVLTSTREFLKRRPIYFAE
jgi:DNA-binding Lrp family transcriptional regulator